MAAPQVPISDFLQATEIGPQTFESLHTPMNQGGVNATIGFGGFTLGFGLTAAAMTVAGAHVLYTASGNFLGPAQTDRKVTARVLPVRDTRTFCTRFLTLSQRADDGSERSVMSLLADFHVPEKGSILEYSAEPSMAFSPPEKSWTEAQMKQEALEKGCPKQIIEFYESRYTLWKYFDKLWCPEDIMTQRFGGMMPHLPTTQDELPVPEMATGHWCRSTTKINGHSANAAAMAFFMDQGSAIMPMAFGRVHPNAVASCSSLDFSLRIFANELNFEQWHLREEKSLAAGEGRTYQESQLWDQKGRLVASLTEQCIMRPRAEKL